MASGNALRGLRPALLAVSLPGIAAAADNNFEFEHSFMLQSFGAIYDIAKNSNLNPDNQLAQLDNFQQGTRLRSKFTARYGGFSAKLSPRFGYFLSNQADGGNVVAGEHYFQDWLAQYATDDLSLSYSRELLYWGPSLFASPSNPFFPNSNQTNPFIEPGAQDFVQLQYFHDYSNTLALIGSLARGRSTLETPNFKKTVALKYDHRGDDYSLSAIAGYRENDGLPQGGMFGQWTLNDSTLLYFDVGMKGKSYGLYPHASDSPLGYELAPNGNGRGWFVDFLAGGSYTFDNGDVLNLEYRHSNEGYSNADSSAYRRMAQNAAGHLVGPDPNLQGLAAGTLAQASSVQIRSLNQHYLYANYRVHEIVEDLSLNVLYSQNLQDGGAQLVPIVEYNLFGQVNLAANLVFNLGGSDTEFGGYLNNIYFLGVKYYFD
ncbi:hypothetical protein NP603_10450 [Methylomonas sp. SURF-1]|uniref:Uncharacterized protein n=1 Tax=Methylomonas aurea TaxID=2952224 RepID=A0ABT1UH21_9GAMM|nr:hypothetical protein [Methylomonas sp. SURF-1]MCQ8181529.1 hypothetical protein [Methylomonas sp. SURF-1]